MSGRSSKAKGYAAERAVVQYLIEQGYIYTERRRAGAAKDTGDITGFIPGACIEVKSHARMALADWVDQLTEEMGNFPVEPAWTGVVIHKRRGKPVEDWYATMPVSIWMNLIKEIDR